MKYPRNSNRWREQIVNGQLFATDLSTIPKDSNHHRFVIGFKVNSDICVDESAGQDLQILDGALGENLSEEPANLFGRHDDVGKA